MRLDVASTVIVFSYCLVQVSQLIIFFWNFEEFVWNVYVDIYVFTFFDQVNGTQSDPHIYFVSVEPVVTSSIHSLAQKSSLVIKTDLPCSNWQNHQSLQSAASWGKSKFMMA